MHEAWGGASFERFWQDLRYAVRVLGKNRGFSATAILVLALGIGTSVAIFAFVDAALIRPLPYADPQRLVHVTESDPDQPPREHFLSRLFGLEETEHHPRLHGCIHRLEHAAEHANGH